MVFVAMYHNDGHVHCQMFYFTFTLNKISDHLHHPILHFSILIFKRCDCVDRHNYENTLHNELNQFTHKEWVKNKINVSKIFNYSHFFIGDA